MPGRKKPNVIIIFTDDQGYADLGCYGSKNCRTPHIDSLAKNGVRFTDGYVCHPYCSPSRAGLLTGRYQQRFGHEYNPYEYTTETSLVIDENAGMPPDQITLANVLKESGYATAIFGKWHLGAGPACFPLKRGFDEFYGFLGGAHNFIDLRTDETDVDAGPIFRNSEKVTEEKEYLTDAITRETCAFIDRHRNQPFFIYVPYNAPHAPREATQKYLDRFKHIPNEAARIYPAMMSAVDDGVGAILQKLREYDLEKDTLVFYLSDNGGGGGADNRPLSGSKARMWEGGIRVPFLFQWPSKVVGGQEYKEPIISLDIFSTAVAAAGAKMPTDRIMDGVDLLPYLTSKKKNPPHEYLFWRDLEMYKSFGKGFAVRKGKWKLFQMPEDYDEVYTRLGAKYAEKHEKRYNSVAEMYAAGPEPRHLNDRELIHLHDLSVDVGETRNLVKQHPEIVEEMMREYKRWESQLQWPRWERGYWERLPITRLAEFEKKRRSQGKG